VVAVGFGERFADARMGVTGDVVPDEVLRRVFDYQFELMRRMAAGEISLTPRTEE
jgi:hypothetical protein